MDFDLSAIEGRFWHDLGDVDSEADGILHSHIAEAVESTGKALIALLPEGSDAEGILSRLDDLAKTVHGLASKSPVAVEGQPESAGAAPVAEVTPPASAPEAPAEKEGLIDRIFHRGEHDDAEAAHDADAVLDKEVPPVEAEVKTVEADVAKVEADLPEVEKAVEGQPKPGA